MVSRWPFPGDRPADRARQVAHAYRAALLAIDETACRAIDAAALSVGEGWVIPYVHRHLPDDWITAQEAAALTGRSVRWVYAWAAADRAHRIHVGNDGVLRVRVEAVEAAANG